MWKTHATFEQLVPKAVVKSTSTIQFISMHWKKRWVLIHKNVLYPQKSSLNSVVFFNRPCFASEMAPQRSNTKSSVKPKAPKSDSSRLIANVLGLSNGAAISQIDWAGISQNNSQFIFIICNNYTIDHKLTWSVLDNCKCSKDTYPILNHWCPWMNPRGCWFYLQLCLQYLDPETRKNL